MISVQYDVTIRVGFYNSPSFHEVTADEVVEELLRGGVPEECITQALVDDIRLQDLTVERVLQHFKARKEAEFEAVIENYFLNDAYLVSMQLCIFNQTLQPCCFFHCNSVFFFSFFKFCFRPIGSFTTPRLRVLNVKCLRKIKFLWTIRGNFWKNFPRKVSDGNAFYLSSR